MDAGASPRDGFTAASEQGWLFRLLSGRGVGASLQPQHGHHGVQPGGRPTTQRGCGKRAAGKTGTGPRCVCASSICSARTPEKDAVIADDLADASR